MLKTISTAILAVTVLASCSEQEASTTETSQPVATNAIVKGFLHTSSRSRFKKGRILRSVSEHGMAREIGEDGVFLTMVQSGAVDALPNATASSRLRPPLTLDANAHNKTVKAYFASAGLPVEQIEELSIQATMATEVRDSQEQKPVLEYYTTFIKRQIQGIQIPDSYASARINIDGDVVTESVHWPAIPQSAIDAALRIRTRLSDPEKAQAFKAKVGDKYGLNRVAVHHTPGEYPGATEAVAAFDVDENTKTFHFDENGDKIVLPQEVLVAPLGGASKK